MKRSVLRINHSTWPVESITIPGERVSHNTRPANRPQNPASKSATISKPATQMRHMDSESYRYQYPANSHSTMSTNRSNTHASESVVVRGQPNRSHCQNPVCESDATPSQRISHVTASSIPKTGYCTRPKPDGNHRAHRRSLIRQHG